VHLGNVERIDEQIVTSERRGDVRVDGQQRAVHADGAHEKHLLELVEPLVVVGEELRLGRVVIVPRLPLIIEALEVVGQVAQHPNGARERDAVQPHRLRHPLGRHGLLGLGVESATSLEQVAHVRRREGARNLLDLHREHERPDLLVPLEEAAVHVARHVVGHVVHDVDDALGGDRRLLGVVDRKVVQLEELLERHHVHVIDRGHVDDHEVEERAAAGGGPVLLARRVDADVGVDGGVELLVDLDGGDL